MSNLWERFNTIATPDEVNNAKSEFTPLDEGTYRCLLEEIQPSESQSGLPMLKGKFRMIEGNRIIFYNQLLQNISNPKMTAINIAEAVKFISDLTGQEYEFTNLGDMADFVSSIPSGTEHMVTVKYGAKDIDRKYPKLKVSAVPNEDDIFQSADEEDLPF